MAEEAFMEAWGAELGLGEDLGGAGRGREKEEVTQYLHTELKAWA